MATEKRLIDANACPALLEEKFKETMTLIRNGETHLDNLAEGFTEASQVIWLMSIYNTVDAVEVVHGKWVAVPSSDMMTGKAYKCSECNKMRYGSFMPNYCSNCGAKMDGGKDNG